MLRLFFISFWLLLPLPFLLSNDGFRPRILIDVSMIDMTTTVLGFKISMPIMIAPTTMQKMAHPEDSSLETCGIQEV
ncbi:hypothetical protein V6Z11_A01G050000 [Gossypium hirsutum]